MKWGQHYWDQCRFHFFWQRDFLGTPVNLLVSSQKCQGVPFSPICQHSLLLQRPHYVVLTPCVCNQAGRSENRKGRGRRKVGLEILLTRPLPVRLILRPYTCRVRVISHPSFLTSQKLIPTLLKSTSEVSRAPDISTLEVSPCRG